MDRRHSAPLARRVRAAASLTVLGALVGAVATGQSPTVRIPLTLLVLFVIPGIALTNAYEIKPSAEWATLVISTSLATSMLVGGTLASLGWLRPVPAALALAGVCGPALLTQLLRRS